MSKTIETVDTHCKYIDCIYRKSFDASGRECCMYAALEHQVRGSKISECTRYTPGRKIKPRMRVTTEIEWEYDYGHFDLFGQDNQENEL